MRALFWQNAYMTRYEEVGELARLVGKKITGIWMNFEYLELRP